MDSEASSTSWWLHREEPESPSPPKRAPHARHAVRAAAVQSTAHRAPGSAPDALSIDQSPSDFLHRASGTTHRGAGVVVHQNGAGVESTPAARFAKLERRCEKWKRRCEVALSDNRILAEEIQRLRASATSVRSADQVPATDNARAPSPAVSAACDSDAPGLAPPAAVQETEDVRALRDRVRVLEQECEDQRAQLTHLTSSTHDQACLSQLMEDCWPLVESVADDGSQFTAALQCAMQAAKSPDVTHVAARLVDVAQGWRTLQESTAADRPTLLAPTLAQLVDAITQERDVLAHLTRAFLTTQAPDALQQLSFVTDTRLREMEEDHMAEMEELRRIIRDLEKRLAAANSLRRTPWSALGGHVVTAAAATKSGFGGGGLDTVPPLTPLADERNGGSFVSSGPSFVAEQKIHATERVEAETQTPVSLEFVMAVAHAAADGASRSVRRSKELDLIDIMAVEIESLRVDLENAKAQLVVLLEQRRRFLGQVDAPLDYSTRVGLVRSTGFNVLHNGDTG